METIPITVNGAKVLEDELLRLKDEVRPRIVNDIATAREHGDLKENAEYHAAKEEQALCRRKDSRDRVKTLTLANHRCTSIKSRWTLWCLERLSVY